MEHDLQNQNWYAISVRTRFENLAASVLRTKGFEEFLPIYRSRRQRSDRTKEIELPLFPGYIFCRFDPVDRLLPILTTPGVISIVGAGKTPVPVPDREISALKSIVSSGLPALPWQNLSVGDKILIETGPLAGLEGIALSVDKHYRLVVSVPLLQRSVAVEIEREWVRPLPRTVPGAFRNRTKAA